MEALPIQNISMYSEIAVRAFFRVENWSMDKLFLNAEKNDSVIEFHVDSAHG
jgi:hypothetical protein